MMHVELVIAKAVTMVIGLLIAGTAYRGYRRSGSESMRYLAVGFAIISIGAVIEGVLFDVLHFSIFWAGTVQTSVVAVGMLVVLYSLYGRTDGYSPDELRRNDGGDSGGEERG
jgi:hypothetical protein